MRAYKQCVNVFNSFRLILCDGGKPPCELLNNACV